MWQFLVGNVGVSQFVFFTQFCLNFLGWTSDTSDWLIYDFKSCIWLVFRDWKSFFVNFASFAFDSCRKGIILRSRSWVLVWQRVFDLFEVLDCFYFLYCSLIERHFCFVFDKRFSNDFTFSHIIVLIWELCWECVNFLGLLFLFFITYLIRFEKGRTEVILIFSDPSQ